MLAGVDTASNIWMFGRPPRAASAPSDSYNLAGFLNVVSPSGEVRSAQAMPGPVFLLPTGNLAFEPILSDDGFISFRISSFRLIRG